MLYATAVDRDSPRVYIARRPPRSEFYARMFHHAFPKTYYPHLVRHRASVSKMPRTYYGRPRRRYSRRRTRRSTAPRRRYRRTSGRASRLMSRTSRRRILNIASKKKQDNMLATRLDAGGNNPTVGAFTIPGTGGQFLWSPTIRDRASGATPSDPTSVSVRESDICYMRGLRESIIFASNSAASWRWRRVCFTCKGLPFGPQVALETNNGWTRLLWNIAGTGVLSTAVDTVFRGTQGIDWVDFFVAKVDTNRVKVYSDTLRTFSSGNQAGKYFKDKKWYPMNENLVYNNDERGEGETATTASTTGRAGMGDYYIMDLFDCTTLAAADTLFFQPEATLYWHEK